MPKRTISLFMNDIVESIEKIIRYKQEITFEQFVGDEKTIDAVLRNLEIIGEAVKNIPDDLKNKYPSIEWKLIAGMRDKLIHSYFGIDLEIIWSTMEFLPELLTEIKTIKFN